MVPQPDPGEVHPGWRTGGGKLTTSPLVNLIRDQVSKKNFRNHVIVGVIADKDSSVLGLKNLIMPLRASNIRLESKRLNHTHGPVTAIHID